METNSKPTAAAPRNSTTPSPSRLVTTLAAYPDLQITGLAVTNSQLRSGNVVGLVWNDANTGAGAVSNQFYDQILVVNQTTAQTLVNTVLADDAAVSPIAAGQSVPRQFSFALPDGPAGAGTLRIVITADIYDNVFEYNTSGTAKSNNTNSLVAASTLAPYPDLLATNVMVPASASAGQTISVTWTEINQGAPRPRTPGMTRCFSLIRMQLAAVNSWARSPSPTDWPWINPLPSPRA